MLEVSSKIKINIRILIIGSKSSPQSSHEQYNGKEKRGVIMSAILSGMVDFMM